MGGALSQSMSQVSTISAEAVSDPSSQINMLLSNPLDFVMDFIRTILVRSTEGFILVTSMIGNFGMLDASLPLVSVVFGYMLLMSIYLYGYKEDAGTKIAQNRAGRLVLISCLAVYAIGVFASMHIFYSLPEHNVIRGVNGRYLVPLLFILVPLVHAKTPVIKEKKYALLVTVGVFVLFLSSFIALFYRYYAS